MGDAAEGVVEGVAPELRAMSVLEDSADPVEEDPLLVDGTADPLLEASDLREATVDPLVKEEDLTGDMGELPLEELPTEGDPRPGSKLVRSPFFLDPSCTRLSLPTSFSLSTLPYPSSNSVTSFSLSISATLDSVPELRHLGTGTLILSKTMHPLPNNFASL